MPRCPEGVHEVLEHREPLLRPERERPSDQTAIVFRGKRLPPMPPQPDLSKVKSVPLVRPKPLPLPQQPRLRAVEPPADPRPIRIETLEREPAPPVSNARPPVETLPGQLIDLADVDVKPRPVRRQLPGYTRRAMKKKQQGRVGLKLLVDERGKIVDLRLLRTIPDSDLNEAAIEAAWRWRFEPASKDGVPVRVWKPVTVVFSTSFGERRVFLLE